MSNISDVQDAILEHLEDSIPQMVVEQAIPDAQTVLRDSKGNVQVYVALQFGDLQRAYTGQAVAGVRHDDYELPVYIQVVAPQPKIARKLASDKILDAMLGFSTDGTGEVRKRPGGGMWPILSSNGATAGYLFPSSYAVTVQFLGE